MANPHDSLQNDLECLQGRAWNFAEWNRDLVHRYHELLQLVSKADRPIGLISARGLLSIVVYCETQP
jgi:hypothetical protein